MAEAKTLTQRGGSGGQVDPISRPAPVETLLHGVDPMGLLVVTEMSGDRDTQDTVDDLGGHGFSPTRAADDFNLHHDGDRSEVE